MRHLVSTTDLTDADLHAILNEAHTFISSTQDGSALQPTLAGRNIVLAFFEPSTRTRLSFEIAAHKLGASTVLFQPEGSSVQKGESLKNTIATITAMGYDAMVLRHAQNGTLAYVSSITSMHIVNAGEGSSSHPTQGLLDASTLLEAKGSLKGLRICLVGDIRHSRVARSQIDVCKRLGAEFALCAPSQFLPNADDELFSSFRVFENIDLSLEWADVMSMLRIQRERFDSADTPSMESYRNGFALTSERMAKSNSITVIHPGPVNIGVELDQDVVDHERSLIHRQVTHGVAVRMAVLSNMIK